MYLLAAGYQIVVYCYNGQRFATAVGDVPGESPHSPFSLPNSATNLSPQSAQIGRAFYECEWYGESREFRQLIGMMLMRTNRDFRLDVSWFMQMSLPTLMAVSFAPVPTCSLSHLIDLQMVRTSGQYFLLLQNVTQK